jgi:transposase
VYVRKKKNKSGSVSFHIVRKEGRKQIHVKSVGSSKDIEQIRNLEILAYRELSKIKQQGTLELSYQQDKMFYNALSDGLQKIEIIGFELILGKLFNEIGFNAIEDDLLRHLVISRISHPGSKLKTVNYLLEHHGIFCEIDAVYRYLDKLNTKHKSLLQDKSYQHTLRLFDGCIRMLFYDVTTLYFEAEDEDDLRKTGFSKDGKAQHPQVVLGLLVSRGGYPLAFEMFEGNKFEGKTMMPVLERFKKKYAIREAIVVADAGLLSNDNIENLNKSGYQFIVGARIKNETQVIKEQILTLNLENGQTHTILKPAGERLIISYTTSRANKDKKNRERGLRRLEQAIRSGKLSKKHINNRGYNKYLKIDGEVEISIDYEKFRLDGRWDGLKGYLTNTVLSPDQVIENYGNLWHIEKAFRISKTDLRIRPIFHRLKRRIESHLIIAFCSYKLYKELERQLKEKHTGISVEKAIRLMHSIFAIQVRMPVSGKLEQIIHLKTDDQKALLEAFEIKI